jgi:hypothetical protein
MISLRVSAKKNQGAENVRVLPSSLPQKGGDLVEGALVRVAEDMLQRCEPDSATTILPFPFSN